MIQCLITENVIDAASLLEAVHNTANGAVLSFQGAVRRTSGVPGRDGRVVRLEYEAFAPMAEKEMLAIAAEAVEKSRVTDVVVHHRVGRLELGETALFVAVTAPHRADAFDACRYVIEELKKRVPIWKKEVFEDGAAWVDPHP